jgi:hypothetical protein
VQFNSCDGLAWATRVRNTYSCTSGSIGENLQAAYSNNPLVLPAIISPALSWTVY